MTNLYKASKQQQVKLNQIKSRMSVVMRKVGKIGPNATATIRSFILPPNPLAVVPIVKMDGEQVKLYLVRDEGESHAITRRIKRGLEKDGVAVYANPEQRKVDCDSWLFSIAQGGEKEYCPKELVRGVTAACALAKEKPTPPERDASNPVCVVCREHCENKWGNSHGFIHYRNLGGDDDDVICNSCNEHEVYYRIHHPTAAVFILSPELLEFVVRLPDCPDCRSGASDFRLIRNRQSSPVLVEFKNLSFAADDESPPQLASFLALAKTAGTELIITARIAELEVALRGIRDEIAERELDELVKEADNVVSTAEVKKPSKKERQADATRGANAVRDQKKKEREAFEKECEKAAKAALAIKRAADEKKRKAKAAKAKVARACP